MSEEIRILEIETENYRQYGEINTIKFPEDEKGFSVIIGDGGWVLGCDIYLATFFYIKYFKKFMYGVDGISGGTITSDGVTDMLLERLTMYLPYFNKIKPTIEVNSVFSAMDSVVTVNDSLIN